MHRAPSIERWSRAILHFQFFCETIANVMWSLFVYLFSFLVCAFQAHAADSSTLSMMSYDDTGSTTQALAILTAVAAILFGLMFLFFGRYLFRPVLFLGGFYMFATLAFTILTNAEPLSEDGTSKWGDSRTGIYIGVCLAVGIVGGILMCVLWKLGLFCLGAYGGFILSILIMGAIPSISSIVRIIVTVLLCLIVGIAAVLAEHHVMIISTSFMGSFSFMYGVDIFGKTGFIQSMRAFVKNEPFDATGKFYGMLAGAFVVAIVGMIVQYTITGKNRSQSRGPAGFQKTQTSQV